MSPAELITTDEVKQNYWQTDKRQDFIHVRGSENKLK